MTPPKPGLQDRTNRIHQDTHLWGEVSHFIQPQDFHSWDIQHRECQEGEDPQGDSLVEEAVDSQEDQEVLEDINHNECLKQEAIRRVTDWWVTPHLYTMETLLAPKNF